MKIVFAIKTMHMAKGGAERVLADVASGLAERGHEVTVVTFDRPDAGETFYPLNPAIRLKRLGIGNAGEKATIFETIRRMFTLRGAIKNESPDVIVGFMHSMFVPLSFAMAGAKVPVVGSEHIVPAHYKTRRIEFLLLCASALLINKITVLSPSIRASYPGFVRSKMVAVPNPVAQALHSADTVAEGIPVKTILNVGRLDPQKDQETLIHAFAKLSKDYPQWRLQIVGEGILHEKLSRLIAELGLKDSVFLYPPTRQIADFYRAAQIFALSSVYESFGLATAEAMAHGLPPVGFADCPGTSELIEDGKTGLLVLGNDRVQAFADGLRQLMDAPEKRRILAENAKIHVRRFSRDAVTDQWEVMLEEFGRG
jgi:glycosyltransferase involved in cell wall biosynthesis